MRIRKLVAALSLIAAVMPLGGCYKNIFPPNYEIDQVEVVRVAGVDKVSDDAPAIEVTFMSTAQRTASTESGSGEQVVNIVSQTGSTVFDAKRKLKAHSDKVMLLSHIDYLIFGEDAAADDFTKYFDCFTRDSELRFTPKIYISRGMPAKELMRMSSTGDKFLADRLENFSYDVQLLSDFGQVKLIEVADMLDEKTAATVIPALAFSDTGNEVFTGDMPKKDVVRGGYAVLKAFRLVGYLDAPIARGYNFLKNNVRSSSVTVTDGTGMNVEIEITGALVSLAASFNGDTLKRVTYKVQLQSIIREQQSRSDIYTHDSLKSMETQLSDIVKNDMLQVIGKSKEFGVDAVGLGDRIRMKHPVRWTKLKNDWNHIFTALEMQVEVTSQIRRTLSIEEPNGYEGAR